MSDCQAQCYAGRRAEGRGGRGSRCAPAIVAGFSLFVCACNTDQQVAGRSRRSDPIIVSVTRSRCTEADHTLEVFVGSNRGELNATQRAEVLAFAQTWRREATGGVLVDLPVGTSNERAATESMRTIRSNPGRKRRAARWHRCSWLSPTDQRACGHPHHLSADSGPGWTMRPLAGRHRAELKPRLFREPAAVESGLRNPTQPRRHGGQSGRPRAAARRNAALRTCSERQSWKTTEQANPLLSKVSTNDTGKISDLGK